MRFRIRDLGVVVGIVAVLAVGFKHYYGRPDAILDAAKAAYARGDYEAAVRGFDSYLSRVNGDVHSVVAFRQESQIRHLTKNGRLGDATAYAFAIPQAERHERWRDAVIDLAVQLSTRALDANSEAEAVELIRRAELCLKNATKPQYDPSKTASPIRSKGHVAWANIVTVEFFLQKRKALRRAITDIDISLSSSRFRNALELMEDLVNEFPDLRNDPELAKRARTIRDQLDREPE